MIRVFIITLLFLASCSDGVPRVEKPDDLIPRKKMIPLLTELVKLEAYITDEYGNITKYHKVMVKTGDSLLNAKGYTIDQFEGSMDYYGSRQEEMMSIYRDVLEDLNKDLGELQRNPVIEDPIDVIPREKMVPLLIELMELEAYVADSIGNITKSQKVMVKTGDSLLKTKGYSKGQFEGSLEYYGSRQEEMMSIYRDVLEDLNKDLGELQRN
jgi:hypothetical protein